MALQHSAPIALRLRVGLKLLVPALVLTSALGCGHRRSSMRPVFVTPAPAPIAAPVVTPSCPAPVEPADVGAPLERAPVAQPAPALPPVDAPVAPAATTPPRPGFPDEPSLEPPARRPTAEPDRGTTQRTPNTSFDTNSRRTASGRLRQASLKEDLRPFVNDPADLFHPPKADRPWKYVVLHHSARESGSYDAIDREHRKVLGWEGCGYHFIIGNGTGSPDGQVEVAQRWSNQKHGVHCRNGKTSEVNEYGIGICLVGDLDDKPPTPRQIAAAKALVAYLGDRYAIPAERMGTHARLANSPTACPGRHFPAQAILGSRNLAQR